jgi:hypothetical protein
VLPRSNILFNAIPFFFLFNCSKWKGSIRENPGVGVEWKLKFKLFSFYASFSSSSEEKKTHESISSRRCFQPYRINYRWMKEKKNISSTISFNKQHPFSTVSRVCRQQQQPLKSHERKKKNSSDQVEQMAIEWNWHKTDLYSISYIFSLRSLHSRDGWKNIIEWISDEREERRILITFLFSRTLKRQTDRLDNCSLNNEREGI